MTLVQTCPLCGQESIVELDWDKYIAYKDGLAEGKPASTHGIQVLFADLDADTRETIMTGIHPHCFDELFAGGDDD